MSLEAEDRNPLAARPCSDPAWQAEAAEIAHAVLRAVNRALTAHQRQVFIAIVLNGYRRTRQRQNSA
ncbi:MAG: hypothetical protein ACRDN0_29195 [Trebonia sp.]